MSADCSVPAPDSGKLLQTLRVEMRRRWEEESLSRAKKCVAMLSEEEIWHRFNDNALSAGNILLHLRGNIRQWVVCGLGGEPDDRNRDAEFEANRTAKKEGLVGGLEGTVREALEVVDRLRPEQVLASVAVQGFQESGLSILIHVTEHFSYHVGELTYITKLLKNADTRYYNSNQLRSRNG